MKKILAPSILLSMVALLAIPASADDQVIDATLSNTVSMTASPTSSVSGWSLASTGANTTSGGSMTINSNSAYTVTVSGDKTRMSEYETATTSYVTSGRTLTNALSVTASRTGGTAVVPGVGAIAVVGTSNTLATGTGLGTDDYSVTLSQPTAITDESLASGYTYHIVLTYTASSTL
jgi:hypothetical protein